MDDGFLVEFGSSKEAGDVVDEVALSKGLWGKHIFEVPWVCMKCYYAHGQMYYMK